MPTLELYTQKKVVSLPQSASIDQAAQAMSNREVGCVIVVSSGGTSSGGIVGIITDRDIALGSLNPEPQTPLTLAEVMTPNPITAPERTTHDEASRLMEEYGIRRLPITRKSESGVRKCVGIVTLDDLIISGALGIERVSAIVKSQIRRRGFVHLRAKRAVQSENRSESRREQTLNHFYHVLGEKTGTSSMELVERITDFLLSAVIKRIHHSGAASLISQLPHDLQEKLFDLPAGPDRSIILSSIEDRLCSGFGIERKQVPMFLTNFFHAIHELTDHHVVDHVRSQLPIEFWEFFPRRVVHPSHEAA